MKKIIVDTNIIFRALRSNYSNVRSLLDNSEYSFYAPNYLVVEIFKHKDRIVKASRCSDEEIIELLEKILQKITFVNEEFVSTGNMIHAWKLCADIDPKDTLFVALTIEMDGLLWTNDQELKVGLIKKGFDRFFNGT